MKTIKFYSHNGEYGCFSNFYSSSIVIDGLQYATTEHYFQSKKFEGSARETAIRKAKGPMSAARMGRDRSFIIRRDWENVKDEIMKKALIAKFTQHQDLKNILLETDDAVLIEDSPTDYYWGCGKTGSGKNMLGKLLMEVRDLLRK